MNTGELIDLSNCLSVSNTKAEHPSQAPSTITSTTSSILSVASAGVSAVSTTFHYLTNSSANVPTESEKEIKLLAPPIDAEDAYKIRCPLCTIILVALMSFKPGYKVEFIPHGIQLQQPGLYTALDRRVKCIVNPEAGTDRTSLERLIPDITKVIRRYHTHCANPMAECVNKIFKYVIEAFDVMKTVTYTDSAETSTMKSFFKTANKLIEEAANPGIEEIPEEDACPLAKKITQKFQLCELQTICNQLDEAAKCREKHREFRPIINAIEGQIAAKIYQLHWVIDDHKKEFLKS